MRSDGILLNTVLIIQLVARRQARAAANPSCTRSQAVAACEFDAWYLCLGGTSGSTTTDDPLAPVAGKTAEDSACYDEGTLADAIHHPEDHQVYTYEDFLDHYAARGWPVEAVRTLWEGLPRARDHLLV